VVLLCEPVSLYLLLLLLLLLMPLRSHAEGHLQ
jgi:hypothetical protein